MFIYNISFCVQDEELIAIANDCEVGLGANVYGPPYIYIYIYICIYVLYLLIYIYTTEYMYMHTHAYTIKVS